MARRGKPECAARRRLQTSPSMGEVSARASAQTEGVSALPAKEAHREAPGYVVAITPSVIALSRDDSFPIEGKRDFPGV